LYCLSSVPQWWGTRGKTSMVAVASMFDDGCWRFARYSTSFPVYIASINTSSKLKDQSYFYLVISSIIRHCPSLKQMNKLRYSIYLKSWSCALHHSVGGDPQYGTGAPACAVLQRYKMAWKRRPISRRGLGPLSRPWTDHSEPTTYTWADWVGLRSDEDEDAKMLRDAYQHTYSCFSLNSEFRFQMNSMSYF